MSFKQFRELLAYVGGKSERGVVYVDPRVDMRDGSVVAIRLFGRGWKKTMKGSDDSPLSLYERCRQFLDDPTEPADPADKQGALKTVIEVITGEYGEQCAKMGEEFGSKDLQFTIPTKLLSAALKEKADVGEGCTTAPHSDA